MNTLKYVVVTLLMISWQSCVLDDVFDCEHGRGEVIEETFDIDEVNAIHLRMDATIYLTQGDERSVTISAQPNIIDEIDFRVRNRELVIDNDRCLRNYHPIEIYITLPDINELSVSGSGSIISQNQWFVNDIQLSISGSGKIDLELDADDVLARVSGSGDMYLVGQVDDLSFSVSGSGSLHGFDLEAQNADINVSGSGNVEVTVINRMEVRISGSGDVYYRGTPDIDSRISGSGKIIDSN
ncbi:MAG: DUF2807 domain-containing protein [Saprospiraceae bacterium]|nr:DUF2807 domain-containing protein [Saprospiraceae bacterium]